MHNEIDTIYNPNMDFEDSNKQRSTHSLHQQFWPGSNSRSKYDLSRQHSYGFTQRGSQFLVRSSSSQSKIRLEKTQNQTIPSLQYQNIIQSSQTNLQDNDPYDTVIPSLRNQKDLFNNQQLRQQIITLTKEDWRSSPNKQQKLFQSKLLDLSRQKSISNDYDVYGQQIQPSIHSFRKYQQIIQVKNLCLAIKGVKGQDLRRTRQEKFSNSKNGSSHSGNKLMEMQTFLKDQYQINLNKVLVQDRNAMKEYFKELDQLGEFVKKDHSVPKFRPQNRQMSSSSIAKLFKDQRQQHNQDEKAVDTHTLNRFSIILRGIKF